jgi:hypothetical protein
MDAGETRWNGKTGTDGDFFVTVDPRNWKRLKEEEEEVANVVLCFQNKLCIIAYICQASA